MAQEPGIIQDLQRLLHLSDILNLDDCETKQCFIRMQTHRDFAFAQMYSDFQALRNYFKLQKRICCIYGVENTTSAVKALKEMGVLIFQLTGYWEDEGKWLDLLEAFSHLKYKLCFELGEFVYEVVGKVQMRLRTCSSESEEERLMETCVNLRSLLPI